MFCPKCGTSNPDGVAFCSECGNPFAQQAAPQPQQVAGAQPQPMPMPGGQQPAGAPNPYAGGVLAKAGNANTKLIIMGVAAVAVVVLLIMLIRAFACSGVAAGAFNLGDIVTKDSKDVASMLSKYEEMRILGSKIIVSDKGAWDKFEDLAEDATDDKKAADELKKMNGAWALRMVDNEYNELKKADVEDGDDPAMAAVMQIVVEDNMTGEKAAKLVSNWVSYDDIIIGVDKHYASGYFTSDTINGNVSLSEAEDEGEGIWMLTITIYDSDEDDVYGSSLKDAKKNWDEDTFEEIYTGK